MSEESFLVVSTGCPHMFQNNSRTRFTNNLAKPAKSSIPWTRSLFIDIEQINFEYTPLYYENEEADIVFNDTKDVTSIKLKKCYSVESLIKQMTSVLSHILYIHKYSSDEKGVKIVLASYYHDVSIHEKLVNLLKIGDNFKDQAGKYLELKKDVEYISNEAIALNCEYPSYIDLICEEIEPYFCDSEFKKIVARIDVVDKCDQTIHIDTLIRRFFKIEASVLESITFELKQPDGRRLLMEDGAPTIIKARIKEMKSKSDFFYLQVNSKPTLTHPENTPGKFTVELPSELELKGEWHVALAYAELPPTRNFFKDKNKILLKNKNTTAPYAFNIIRVNTRTGGLYPRNITFTAGGVLPFTSLLKTIRDASQQNIEISVDEDENLQIFSVDKDEVMEYFITFSPAELENFVLENCKKNRALEKVNFEEFLNKYSADESAFKKISETHNVEWLPNFDACYRIQRKPLNPVNSGKFSFTLDEYYFNEVREKNLQKTFDDVSEEAKENTESKNLEEEKKLMQIYEKNYNVKRKRSAGEIPTWMFIYSDFVKPSLIADCYSNVLKLLPYKQNATKGGKIFYTFTPLDFFNVNKDLLRTLTFELRTHAGEIHDFRNEHDNTSLTLFFKKIE